MVLLSLVRSKTLKRERKSFVLPVGSERGSIRHIHSKRELGEFRVRGGPLRDCKNIPSVQALRKGLFKTYPIPFGQE